MIPKRSIAAMRSTLVGPITSRMIVNTTPKNISAAATTSAISVKGLLQKFLERACDQLSGLIRIGGHDIKPVNEQRIALDVHDEGPRGESDGVCQRQSPDR